MGGAAKPCGLLHSLPMPEPELCLGLANSQALAAMCRPCQVMPQAVARVCNHTCVEPSFVLSARTRLEPFSAAE